MNLINDRDSPVICDMEAQYWGGYSIAPCDAEKFTEITGLQHRSVTELRIKISLILVTEV